MPATQCEQNTSHIYTHTNKHTCTSCFACHPVRGEDITSAHITLGEVGQECRIANLNGAKPVAKIGPNHEERAVFLILPAHFFFERVRPLGGLNPRNFAKVSARVIGYACCSVLQCVAVCCSVLQCVALRMHCVRTESASFRKSQLYSHWV